MTFRDACLQLGITEENLYNNDSDAEDNLNSNNSNRADEKGMQISEEEEEIALVVDDEGNVEIFEENAIDKEDEEDETVNANDSDTDHEDEEYVLSQSGIEYSTRPIPARRRMQNILTQSSKVIDNPRSEMESFELFLSEDILRTVLMHINKKARKM